VVRVPIDLTMIEANVSREIGAWRDPTFVELDKNAFSRAILGPL
jgi:hypothetical protein